MRFCERAKWEERKVTPLIITHTCIERERESFEALSSVHVRKAEVSRVPGRASTRVTWTMTVTP